jgi:hypothetical protein
MKRVLVLIISAMLTCVSSGSASVPMQLTIQGRLSDSGGSLSGSHAMQFRIFDAQTGGNLIWTETQSLTVESGLFTGLLGQTSPLPASLFTGQTFWLETTVDGTTLSPRRPLVSTAYSFRAQRADTADVALSGSGGSGQWSTDGTNVWRSGGNVGIGNAAPAFPLDLVGNLKIRLQATGNNSGMSFNTAAESPSIEFHASDNSPRFTLATQFTANNPDDVLRFNGNPVSDILALKGNGNVGIGTSNPIEQLHIERSSGTAAILVRSNVPGTGTYGAIQFQNTLATGAGVAAQIAAVRPVATWGQESDLVFSTNPGSQNPALTERMRITKDGKVGIGTANPLDFFEVAGNSMTIGAYDGTLNDVVLRAAGGCPNCGSNSEGGSNLVLRTGIGTGAAASGDIVFQVSDNVNYGNQQPHAVIEGMRIQTGSGNVIIPGSLTVLHEKCRGVPDSMYGMVYFNAVESGEAIFTTSGRAQLEHGKCHVELDPKWLAGVTIDDKHPLEVTTIMIYGPHGQEYPIPETTGFDLVDPSGTTATFFWAVQARQKGFADRYLNRPELEDVSPTGSR